MRTRWKGWLLATAAAGCAGPASYTPNPVVRRDPEARRAEREIARIETERDALRRDEAERTLAGLPSMTDPLDRRRTVIRAMRLDPAWLVDLEPADVAALAPDVLRVYDLGAVLDDGTDEVVVAPPEDADRRFDGAETLLRRIAGAVRGALPASAWDEGSTTVDVAGDCVVVVQSPDAFAAVERALDRTATVAGGVIRVTASLSKPGAAAVDPLVFDVPLGRTRQGWDGAQTSYVKDFDVDAASRVADPIVDSIADGVRVSATYAAGDDGRAAVALDAAVSEVVRPMQEFTTYLIDAGPPAVRIQIPELRVARAHADVELADAAAARSFSLAGYAIDVRVDPPAAGSPPARPGWRRVAPSNVRRVATDEPLVENALQLASAKLRSGPADAAATELKSAALVSRGTLWARRIRPGPETTEALLLRRPVAQTKEDVLAALDAADVRAAPKIGFLAVRDGSLVACIAPESAGALRRALGSLDRRPQGTSTLRITTDRPTATPGSCVTEPGACSVVSCSSAENVSFIRDFDLDIVEDAVLADPIIGVIENGAAVSARRVGSSPDTYDVSVRHTVLTRPIQVFETPIGVGPPVSIQLPRMHVRTETVRVRLPAGTSAETTSVVRSDAGEDSRRFSLTCE